jgi:FHA domain
MLRRSGDGRISLLEPEHLVGRSALCALQLNETYVSAQHASFRWTSAAWELKDLGSRNGTFLNGTQIRGGQPCPVRRGAVIAFGQLDQEWHMDADEAPRPMVVALDSSDRPFPLDGDILALPSADDPQMTIYRGSDGQWRIERSDEPVTFIENQSRFEIGGRTFRFSCPVSVASTTTCERNREIRSVRLAFKVSRDEEYVHLRAECAGASFDLGSRAHHYLLLTLARHRLADATLQLPETSCGWVYQDDLVKALASSPPQLNIDIFRIRKQFSGLGILDASDIVERRPRTRQLRIGVASFDIASV